MKSKNRTLSFILMNRYKLENLFRIIHFVDEKGLEAKVPKSAWTKELKGMRIMPDKQVCKHCKLTVN